MNFNSQINSFNRGTKYFTVILMLLGGIGLLAYSIFATFPSPDSLQKICGTLKSYSFGRPNTENQKSDRDNTFYFSLNEYSDLFFSEAITPKNYQFVVSDKQAQICFCIAPKYSWAGKTYGFWVNGKPIRTAEGSIRIDKKIVRQLFPILSAIILGISIFAFIRLKKSKGIEPKPFLSNIKSRPIRMLIAFFAMLIGLKYFFSKEFASFPFTLSGWLVISAVIFATTSGILRIFFEKKISEMDSQYQKYLLNVLTAIIIVLFGLSLYFKSN